MVCVSIHLLDPMHVLSYVSIQCIMLCIYPCIYAGLYEIRYELMYKGPRVVPILSSLKVPTNNLWNEVFLNALIIQYKPGIFSEHSKFCFYF